MKGGTHEITHRLFFLERPYGTDCKNACRQNKGGRLFRIERNPPYSTDYETCSEVEGKADAEEKLRPALKLPLPDIRTFDAIFLAFPIWYYTYPGVIRSFLSSYPDWMGKPIYIFPNSLDEDPGFLPNTMKEAEKDAKMQKSVPAFTTRN